MSKQLGVALQYSAVAAAAFFFVSDLGGGIPSFLHRHFSDLFEGSIPNYQNGGFATWLSSDAFEKFLKLDPSWFGLIFGMLGGVVAISLYHWLEKGGADGPS